MGDSRRFDFDQEVLFGAGRPLHFVHILLVLGHSRSVTTVTELVLLSSTANAVDESDGNHAIGQRYSE